MGKEIERKWLLKQGIDINALVDKLPYQDIKDYYFNDYCRLRNVAGEWYITIKSLGDLVRDEYEFPVCKEDIDFIPAPILRKRRYFYDKDGYTYEINVFQDLYVNASKDNLVIVELELPSLSSTITLPDFCGIEVTHKKELYGYNLFQLEEHTVLKSAKITLCI